MVSPKFFNGFCWKWLNKFKRKVKVNWHKLKYIIERKCIGLICSKWWDKPWDFNQKKISKQQIQTSLSWSRMLFISSEILLYWFWSVAGIGAPNILASEKNLHIVMVYMFNFLLMASMYESKYMVLRILPPKLKSFGLMMLQFHKKKFPNYLLKEISNMQH